MGKCFILLVLLCVSFIAMVKPTADKQRFVWVHQISNPGEEQDTTFRLITSRGHSFGYEILVAKKTLIRQMTVPTQGGTAGFKRKADAQKVAKLVIEKLRQGIMPPTIRKEELDKLKIKY